MIGLSEVGYGRGVISISKGSLGIKKCHKKWKKFTYFFLRGVPKIKIFPISNLSQIRYRGGVIEFQIFPKFKKVQNFLGEEGGGVKMNVDFFPFL